MVVKIHVVVAWFMIQFICLVGNNILEKYYTSIFRNNDYITQLPKRSHDISSIFKSNLFKIQCVI